MKPLFYILRKTLKNHILQLKKKPGILILYLLILIFFIFIIVSSFIMPQKSSVNGNADTYGAIATAAILMVAWYGVKNGIDNGSSFFRLSDVNLVFTAPLSSKKVLIYGFIKQLYTSLFLVMFLLFQIPNARNFLPITGAGIIIILLVAFFLIFTMSILGLLTYSITSKSSKTRNIAKKILNIVTAIFGIALLSNIYIYKDFSKAAVSFLNNSFFIYIPFIGWIKSILMAAVNGITYSFFIHILLCVIVIISMIYALYKLNSDYYEDVLAATDKKEEMFAMKKSGKSNINYGRKKFRKIKPGNIGNGSSAIFYRHLLEYKKSGIPFIDKMTLIMVGVGLGSRYIVPGGSMSTVLYFSIYMLFFFTSQGKWSQELSKQFIFLIPYSSMSKLFYSTLADLIKYTIDGLVLFAVSGIIFKSNPLISILSAITYASFGAIYTYGDVLSRRFLGSVHSKTLGMFIKMGITLLVILPGIIIHVALLIRSGDNSSAQYISYIVLIWYNIIASFLIMLLSKGVFDSLEMD
ncbi:putative ABC exporter domain-containing protein [Clostridium sp.]|uniref:putative ABC exporter domain-containing protein n=1 Tax=Clostridium sp. TaxID=1506 RepID=UPI001A47461F|nr:putative ABC exporter domain-containing protein [Clostridium sp.]MBK5241444.1 putative ABC exporter domain-containing protein [Clostridium sp.]